MHKAQQKRYDSLYQQHVNALKRQGKSKATIDGYSRAVRRRTRHFNRCPDRLKLDDLKEYFSSLIESHCAWMYRCREAHGCARADIIVPGGCLNKKRQQWKKLKGKYLFNQFALAKVFRARFLESVRQTGFTLPDNNPKKWVSIASMLGEVCQRSNTYRATYPCLLCVFIS